MSFLLELPIFRGYVAMFNLRGVISYGRNKSMQMFLVLVGGFGPSKCIIWFLMSYLTDFCSVRFFLHLESRRLGQAWYGIHP